jgi:hypothetical protein
VEARGDAGDRGLAGLDALLDGLELLERLPDRLLDRAERLRPDALRRAEDLLLRGLEEALDVRPRLVAALHEPLRHEHHVAEAREVLHDARVVADVRGGADGALEREGQLARHLPAEEPLRVEPLLDHHGVEGLRLLRELDARLVHVLVLEPVEVPRLERRRHLIEGGVVREDRAEDGLFCLEAVGEVAGGPERERRVGAAYGIVLRHGRGH